MENEFNREITNLRKLFRVPFILVWWKSSNATILVFHEWKKSAKSTATPTREERYSPQFSLAMHELKNSNKTIWW